MRVCVCVCVCVCVTVFTIIFNLISHRMVCICTQDEEMLISPGPPHSHWTGFQNIFLYLW